MKTRACQRCSLPALDVLRHGTLYLRAPQAHTGKRLEELLESSRVSWTRESGQLYAVRVEHETEPLFASLEQLSALELQDVRALFQPETTPLGLDTALGADALVRLLAKARSGWLVRMIQERRLLTAFQPILRAADGEVFAYECLLRGYEDGKLVAPGRLLDVARRADLMFPLDQAARTTAIRSAAQHDPTARYFVNFTPGAVYDPVFCLRTTMAALEEVRLPRTSVVFEVVESERVDDVGHLRRILDYYREQGFRIALDDVGAGYSSLNLLNALRPDFIKLDRELVSDVDRDPFKASIAAKLLEAANELDLETIAEGIETAGEYEWLRAHGAKYVQGFHFARPVVPEAQLRAAS